MNTAKTQTLLSLTERSEFMSRTGMFLNTYSTLLDMPFCRVADAADPVSLDVCRQSQRPHLTGVGLEAPASSLASLYTPRPITY